MNGLSRFSRKSIKALTQCFRIIPLIPWYHPKWLHEVVVFFTYGELTYMRLMYGKTSHANFPVLGSQRPYAYAPDGPGLSKNIVQVYTAELRRALPSAHHSPYTKTQWHLVTITVQLPATRGYKMHHSGSHPGYPPSKPDTPQERWAWDLIQRFTKMLLLYQNLQRLTFTLGVSHFSAMGKKRRCHLQTCESMVTSSLTTDTPLLRQEATVGLTFKHPDDSPDLHIV